MSLDGGDRGCAAWFVGGYVVLPKEGGRAMLLGAGGGGGAMPLITDWSGGAVPPSVLAATAGALGELLPGDGLALGIHGATRFSIQHIS